MALHTCREHSTMSLIKYQNQYPKIWIIVKELKFYQKKITPKIREWPQNDTQKSRNGPERYPEIRE